MVAGLVAVVVVVAAFLPSPAEAGKSKVIGYLPLPKTLKKPANPFNRPCLVEDRCRQSRRLLAPAVDPLPRVSSHGISQHHINANN